jgi:streptogramin lyase
VNDQNAHGHNVGQITPTGQVSEFQVCDFCFPTDIVQGSDGILYFTKIDASLGRITTGGTVLPDIPATFSPNGNGLDAYGQIGRLDPTTRVVTEIDVEGFPCAINIASDGAVWFTERFAPQAVGRINPATNAVTLFPVDGGPEEIAPAADGSMWFTRSTAGNIVRMSRPPVSSRPSRRPSRAANPSGSRSPPTPTPGSRCSALTRSPHFS